MGEVEFFDFVKKANMYLNNHQREVLINIISEMTDIPNEWEASSEL